MNIIVIRAEMIRITLEDRLQHGQNFLSAFVRPSVVRPELPRVQVHDTLGVQACRVQIVGIVLHQFGHGASVGRLELGKIGYRLQG